MSIVHHNLFLGKVFECSIAEMLQSLDSLDEFDDSALIWPGHEYSLENLRFACHIEPDNEAAIEKRTIVAAMRQQRMPTVYLFLFKINIDNSLKLRLRLRTFLKIRRDETQNEATLSDILV